MIDICLFGCVRVRDLERQIVYTDFHGVKPRQVLQLLALNRGLPIAKERLAQLLWDDDPPASWLSTLEGYVSLLRRALHAGVTGEASAVVTSSGGYLLDARRVRVDVDRFDALVTQADRARPGQAQHLLVEALTLVRGEVLQGERTVPWVVEVRSRYDRRVRRAAFNAARLSLWVGDWDAAERYAQWACELDPLAEDAWQIVIEARWRTNRRAEALRSFSAVRHLLEAELGILPGQALQRLHLAVLRDEPDDHLARVAVTAASTRGARSMGVFVPYAS